MDQEPIRRHVLALLRSEGAHADFNAVIEDFPAPLQGRQRDDLPYTAWQLLEHLRIAQWDIVEFSRRPDHSWPEWPAGYWPRETAPPHPAAWEESLAAFRAGLAEMQVMVADPGRDLLAPLAWGDGQTLLREALLLADHNAYHLGEMVVLRRLLGAWKD